jgi:hypothetical protein
MHIFLVSADDIDAFDPGSAKTYPKIGLLSLIGYLRGRSAQRSRLTFTYRDMLLEGLRPADVGRDVGRLAPDLIGISALSYSEDAFHAVAAAVRAACPEAVVVGGGPYVSSSRESVLADPNVDVLVLDEGEATFCDLVDCLAEGAPLSEVAGIVYRDRRGRVVSTPARELIEVLEEIPLPAYDLVEFDAYARLNPHLDVGGRFAPIVTSRGCPFRCVYCHALHGKKTRFRSAESVVDEIETLYRLHGVQLFYIYDDIFNLDRARAKAICRGIIARKLDVGIDFLNGLRGDMMDHELIELMLDAGTYYFAYAVETATPRLQDVIRKYNDLDALADTIETTVALGAGRAVVATYNMIGFPSETEDEIWNTIAYNDALHHHIADVAVAIPQKNTEMYRMAEAHGTAPTTSHTLNYGQRIPLSASEHISPARLGELRQAFRRTFYGPDRLVRLDALAAVDGPRAQRKYLGAFLRGYRAMSANGFGDVNATLRTGERDMAMSAAH